MDTSAQGDHPCGRHVWVPHFCHCGQPGVLLRCDRCLTSRSSLQPQPQRSQESGGSKTVVTFIGYSHFDAERWWKRCMSSSNEACIHCRFCRPQLGKHLLMRTCSKALMTSSTRTVASLTLVSAIVLDQRLTALSPARLGNTFSDAACTCSPRHEFLGPTIE